MIDTSIPNPNDTLRLPTCHPHQDVLNAVQKYYLPVVIAVGIIGNLLSILVLLTTSLKSKTSTIYLVPLAGADSGYLTLVLLTYISPNPVFDIFNTNGSCKLMYYISTVCAFLSVWLTVGFTTERFIAVWYPLKRLYFCTRSRIKWCVVIIFAVGMVYTIPLFWLVGISVDKKVCQSNPDYKFQSTVFLYLENSITFLVPLPFLAGLNILVGLKIFKSERHRSIPEPIRGMELADMVSEMGSIAIKDSCSRTSSQTDRSQSSQRTSIYTLIGLYVSRRGVPRTQTNITKMLFLVSTVFVLLNVPSFLVRVIFLVRDPSIAANDLDLECASQSAQVLYITNFGVNFLLYTMCGKTFRNHCYIMFRRFFKRITNRFDSISVST